MSNEKALYIKLPDGTNYLRTEKTEDGSLRIVYKDTSLPKPKPLIGGSEVYQKDNGTPYWYCKIKDGRDEFMYVPFDDLTIEDWYYDSKGNKRDVKDWYLFENKLLRALENKPKEGGRWIPVFEPSKDSNGNLQYVAGCDVWTKLAGSLCMKVFKEYSPINGSQLSSFTTYLLLMLRWLKDDIATLDQLLKDSSKIGNYSLLGTNSSIEKTGKRFFGGIYGFVGNTFKQVSNPNCLSQTLYMGGSYKEFGRDFPVADDAYEPILFDDYGELCKDVVGLLELVR